MSENTRIDFYILAAKDPASRLHFACRLTEKAYALQHEVYAHAETPEEARQLDDMLWTFRQGSFVPHTLIDDGDQRAPVRIGTPEQAQTEGELLINLTAAAPDFAANFSRVAEIVDNTEAAKKAGRERFRQYRSMGFDPVTHNID